MSADQYNNPNQFQGEVPSTSSLEEAARAAVRAARGESSPISEASYQQPELAADYTEPESLAGYDLPKEARSTSTEQVAVVIPFSSRGGAAMGSLVTELRGVRDAA